VRRLLIGKYATGVIAPADDIVRIAFSSTPYAMIEKLLDNIFNAAKEVGNK
jgi:hypothetical protein